MNDTSQEREPLPVSAGERAESRPGRSGRSPRAQGARGGQGNQGTQAAQEGQGNQGTQAAQAAREGQGNQEAQAAQEGQGTQGAQAAQAAREGQGNQGTQAARGGQGNQGAQGARGSSGTGRAGRTASRGAERGSAKRRIGIRELRQHASVYVDLAEKGYTVDITNRGRLVAQLVPAQEPGSPMERLIAAGVIEPAEEPGGVRDLDPYPPTPAGQPTASEVLGRPQEEE